MTQSPKSDWTDRADIQVAIIITALWAALTLSTFWNNFPQDLSALYFAGRFWALDQFDLVYAAPKNFFGFMTDPDWLALKADLGLADKETFSYVYPPIWAAILAPITTALSPSTFFNAVYVVHVIMIASIVWLLWSIAAVQMPKSIWAGLSFLAAFASVPTGLALVHNQPQITVSFLMVFAMERYMSGHSRQAGIALGLAAALKLSPIALVLIFVMDRDWRAAGVTCATAGGLAALSFAVAGPDMHWVFLDRLRVISDQIILTNVNYSIELVIYETGKLLTGNFFWPETVLPGEGVTMLALKPVWVGLLSKLLLGVGVVVAIWSTRLLPPRERTILRFAGLWIVVTLCAPLSWSHHYLPIALIGPVMWRFLSQRSFVVFFGLFLALQSTFVFEMLVPLRGFHAIAFVGVATQIGIAISLFWIAHKRSRFGAA